MELMKPGERERIEQKFLNVTGSVPEVIYVPTVPGIGMHYGKKYEHDLKIFVGRQSGCFASGYLSNDLEAVLVLVLVSGEIRRRGIEDWLFRCFLYECHTRGVILIHAYFAYPEELQLAVKVLGKDNLRPINQNLRDSATVVYCLSNIDEALRGLVDGTIASMCVDIDLATLDIESIRKESPFNIPT